jgi:quercetin dioxygenase-like cupin family protein
MSPQAIKRRGLLGFTVTLVTAIFLSTPFMAMAQQEYVVRPVTEKRLKVIQPGSLYWRVENFPALSQARAVEGPTSLAAEIAGKVWLFTLGPKGGASQGGSNLVEIGPVPVIDAPEYLLRINFAEGPPGARTPVHTHPGSETFYVLKGRLGQVTPQGDMQVEAGQSMAGHAPGMPMQVYSSGNSDLAALVMFLVDATKPFSSPAKFD